MAEWEASKENIIPLKRGRALKVIEGSNAPNEFRQTEQLEKQRLEELEKNLKEYTGPSINRLNIYCAHYKWIRDSFPSNFEKALQFLERCTLDFKDDVELKNDQRFVKMWIEYADMVRTPGEVFTYMQQNKIGENVALFWIAWAFVAEKNENFKFADQVFQKGIRKLAEPKEIMQKRYQQFQRRMARHFLEKADEMETQATAGTEPSSSSRNVSLQNRIEESQGRITLGKLSTSQAVTSNRISTAQVAPLRNFSSSSQPTTAAALLARRPPLHNAIPFSVYVQPDEPLLHASDDDSDDMNLGHIEKPATAFPKQADMRKENEGRLTTWSEAPLSRPPGSTQTRAASVPAMQIFVDSPSATDEASDGVKPDKCKSGDAGANFKTNSTGLSIRRFLDGDAVPQSSTATTSATSAGTKRGVAVQKKQKDTLDASNHAVAASVAADSKRPRLAVTNTERIASDPLARHKAHESTRGATAPLLTREDENPPLLSSVPATNKGSVSRGGVRWPSKSNSSEFISPGDDENTSVPVAGLVAGRIKTASERSERTDSNSVTTAAASQPPATFSVSADSIVPEASGNSWAAVSCSKTVSTVEPKKNAIISIFSDNSPILDNPLPILQHSKQSSSSAQEIASFHSKVPIPKPGSLVLQPPAPIFHIFSDIGDEKASVPPPVMNGTANTTAPAAERKTPAAHLTAAPKAQSNADAEENEAVLQEMLAQMGVLDNEDGTINTRLARKDIDSMFCSPTTNFKIDDRSSRRGGGLEPSGLSMVRPEEFLSPLHLSSGGVEINSTDFGFNNSACKALKPLPLPSFAGGTFPSSFRDGTNSCGGHINFAPGAPSFKIFGGNDLSAIKEVSTEYSSIFSSTLSSTQLEAESRTSRSPLSSMSSHPLVSLAQGIASGRVSRRGARDGGLGSMYTSSTSSSSRQSDASSSSYRDSFNHSIAHLAAPPESNDNSPPSLCSLQGDVNAFDLPNRLKKYRPYGPPARARRAIHTEHETCCATAATTDMTDTIAMLAEDDKVEKKWPPNDAKNNSYPEMFKSNGPGVRIRATDMLPEQGDQQVIPITSEKSGDMDVSGTQDQQGRETNSTPLAAPVSSSLNPSASFSWVRINAHLYESQKLQVWRELLCILTSAATHHPSSLICVHHPDMPMPKFLNRRVLSAAASSSSSTGAGSGRDSHRNGGNNVLVGKGSFGYAVHVASKDVKLDGQTPIQPGILKVDYDKAFVVWEAYIHSLIMTRLDDAGIALRGFYRSFFVPPSLLHVYSDAAVLRMDYAELGTMIELLTIIRKQTIDLSSDEHEMICAYFTIQMLLAVDTLHSLDILHGDVKTDNWVLRYSDKSLRLSLCLIDFGKSKDLRIDLTTSPIDLSLACCAEAEEESNGDIRGEHKTLSHIPVDRRRAVFFSRGTAGPKSYTCPGDCSKNFTYQSDYYAVCACMHQLLFGQELSTTLETPETISRRGFSGASVEHTEHSSRAIRVPMISLKRYWKREAWSAIYFQLLNHSSIESKADLGYLALQLERQVLGNSFFTHPTSYLEDEDLASNQQDEKKSAKLKRVLRRLHHSLRDAAPVCTSVPTTTTPSSITEK